MTSRAGEPGRPAGGVRRRTWAVTAGLVLLVGVLSMPAEIYRGDPVTTRLSSWSLVTRGELAVPAALASRYGERGQYFVENEETGAWYSKYGVLNVLLYAVPLWFVRDRHAGEPVPPLDAPDVLLALNVFNLAFALLAAYHLLRLAARFTARPLLQVVFVLACFYGTFLWNFLRAQSFEVYRVAFFLGFHDHLLRAVDGPSGRSDGEERLGRHALYATLYLGLLCLSKQAFVLLVPVEVAALVLMRAPREPGLAAGVRRVLARDGGALVRLVGLPLLATALALLLVNAHQYGSPWRTGYHQWEQHRDVFTGSLGAGLYGFLIDPQYSVFVCFPVLALSLLGWPRFWREHRGVALVDLSIFAAFLLLHAKTPFWKGGWSYGPRYLLFVLPVLSLPFVTWLDAAPGRTAARRWARRAGMLAAAAVLLASARLQAQVNALPFFTWFELEALCQRRELADRPEVREYLDTRPFGWIEADLVAGLAGEPGFVPLDVARELTSGIRLERIETELAGLVRSNLYWFP